MVISGRGAQPTGGGSRVQAAVVTVLCGVLPVLLAGCSSFPSALNPVDWWHNLQGGAIAEQRPPPPGSTEAYPNLATVPPKPEPPDRKALDAVTQGLIADRAHAQYLAAATPITDPSSPQASPGLFGAGTMPPPPPPGSVPPGTAKPGASGGASASLPAASAPPEPKGPPPAPSSAPRAAVQSAPLAAPVAPAAPAPTPGPTTASAPPAASTPAAPTPAAISANAPPAATAANAPLAPPGVAVMPAAPAAPSPPIPAAPPAPPNLPGAPSPAVVAMAAVPAAPPVRSGTAVSIEFVTGSADLPPGANDLLKQLVAKRGQAVIVVTGHGEATSNDPAAQGAALTLALARAQATAKALATDGVPDAAVRVGAQAGGRGADARLVQ